MEPERRKKVQHEIKIAAKDLGETIKRLVKEGNARRIRVRNAKGVVVVDVPLTMGVIGTMLTPVWISALGLLAAASRGFTIELERLQEKAEKRMPGPRRRPTRGVSAQAAVH